jgi:Fe(3+) dicitrate transport protein
MKHLILLLVFCLSHVVHGQILRGKIFDPSRQAVPGVKVENLSNKERVLSQTNGQFEIAAQEGHTLQFSYFGFDTLIYTVLDENEVSIKLSYSFQEIEEAVVERSRLAGFDVGILPPIKGVQITTGTNAVISLEDLNGAKSTGNPRELYARIPGLNIWESDGAGIQLGIGGRGLSPKRAENFNTRQNGYDISADALGYPESYYTPATEGLSSIEIVRGSASLQYGTQFGGLLNFIIREPPKYTPFEITSRSTFGQYGYQSYFNRLAGTKNRWSYQVFHQLKTGKGYRENGEFEQNQLFAQLGYDLNENAQFRLEFTHMDYLAKQSGGLADAQFLENPRASYRERNWFQVKWNIAALHFDFETRKRGSFNWRTFGISSSREALGFLGKITQQDPGGNRDLIRGTFLNGGSEMRFLQKYDLKLFSETRSRGGLLVGGRYYQGQTSSEQGEASSGEDADFRFNKPNNLENSSYLFPSENLSFFLENILFINSKWSIHFGARQEFIQSAAEGFYRLVNVHPVNGDTLSNQKLYNSSTKPRQVTLVGGGSSFKLSRSVSTYVNFTQNYRAINFSDIRINNPNIIVDSSIRDEYGSTSEIGLRGTYKRMWTYDVAGFYIFYGDKIGIAPQTGSIKRIRTNIGDAVNYGLELFTEFDFLKLVNDSTENQLRLFVNTSFIQSSYVRSKEANFIGKQVEYVAPFILRTGIKFVYKQWSTQVQFSYTAAQFSDASNATQASGDATIGLVPAYAVGDFSTRYRFSKVFSMEFGVNNFTNESYFTRRATAYPGPGILPADGINVYGTLLFQLGLKIKR